MPTINKPLPPIDSTWSLFLDRDGVINVETGDYIYTKDEFQFEKDVLTALQVLNNLFAHIIVVTNQRGVGKGWMSLVTLDKIHRHMLDEIIRSGGRIDEVYHCISMDDDHPDRKPNPGMAHRAKEKFPNIDFTKSIMIGDKLGDMQLGRNIGAFTVLIPSLHSENLEGHPDVDAVFRSLYEFTMEIKS